jgi:hypothetical protein
VTEKVTNNIDVFSVNSDGSLSQPTITPDPIPGVFDVVFSPGGAALIVQTGRARNANVSSVSSYLVQEDGTLLPVTGSVPTLGDFTCYRGSYYVKNFCCWDRSPGVYGHACSRTSAQSDQIRRVWSSSLPGSGRTSPVFCGTRPGREERFRQGPIRPGRGLRELGGDPEKSAPKQRRKRERPH